MYHSISSYASPKFRPCIVSPEVFEEHLSYLEQHHYTSMTVTQFVQAMDQGWGKLPPRPVILTFDDGYEDFYTCALPALQRHGFVATLYIATMFVGGTSRWLQREGESLRPMLMWDQVAKISASGIECGAHTHTHPPLDMLSPSVARSEIVHSKELLEEHLGQHVSSFAYPFGYYTSVVRRIVQESGYTSACAIKHTISSPVDDPYALARLAIKPDTDVHDLATALSSGCGPLVASPVKRIRANVRQGVRGVYGKLWAGWSAIDKRASKEIRSSYAN
ncbi:MAG: polysaccharide deacetylase family protein [Ktedonobacteraceae bacterium]|nr:polysaccharide deacetylase family protein [Ktedonobacteraceae bacterium]